MMRIVMLTELRLMLRSPAVWLVTLAGAGLAAFLARGSSQPGMLAMLPELAFPFILLGQMLLTAAAARRERSERVAELVDALPYRPSAWVWGRLLVHYLLWVAVSLLLWAVGAAGVVLAGEPLDLGLLLSYWAVVAPIAIAFATGISYLVGSLVPSAAAAYFLTAGVWISGPFSTVLLSKGGDRVPAPLLEYFASGRYFPAGVEGFYPNGALLLAQRLFTIALGGAACTFVLWYLSRRRGLPTRLLAGALALMVLTGGAAGAVTQSVWAERTAAYEREVAGYPRGTPSGAATTSALVAERYSLSVELDPPSHQIRVKGEVTAINTGDTQLSEMAWTLRRNLTVTAVTDSTGQPIPFEQEEDSLLLGMALAPGESRTLQLAWEGEVFHWRMANGPHLGAHVAPGSVMLPASYGWYPLPGQQQLSFQYGICDDPADESCRWELHDRRVGHRPASMAVTVTGSDLNLLHNAGEGVTGLWLIGTTLETRVVEGIEVTASALNRLRAERLARGIAALASDYDQIVPQAAPGPIRLIETSDSLLAGMTWRAESAAFPGAVLVHHSALGSYQEAKLHTTYLRPVLHLWWPSGGGRIRNEQEALVEVLGFYMEALHRSDWNSPAYQFDWRIQVLAALEEARGPETVITLLLELHGRLPYGGPTMEEFQQAVLAHAGDDPAVLAKLAEGERGRRR